MLEYETQGTECSMPDSVTLTYKILAKYVY